MSGIPPPAQISPTPPNLCPTPTRPPRRDPRRSRESSMLEASSQCTFCAIAKRNQPTSFVYDDRQIVAFMDIHPVNKGHVLVAPRQHFASLRELPETIGIRIFIVGQRLAAAIRRSGVRCEGVSLTLADGAAAGQDVMHCHLHVLPRFEGDAYRVCTTWSAPPRHELDAVATLIRSALTDSL
jgi:diadenosine tetraphosphate (Ap4A) HIT family hydrolase